MRFFDSHTHVNLPDFKSDTDETIKRALDSDTWMVNVGTDLQSSKLAVQLADKYPSGIFASVGLHPTDSPKDRFDESDYEQLITDKVVAIGECGLDYFHEKDESMRKQQAIEFEKQLNFANKQGLPVIIHCRDAYPDLFEILKKYPGIQAVAHSFTEDWATAKRVIDSGFYLALNGILTFDKSGRLEEVAKNVSLNRLLIETDAPFLTPPPHRGKRNEPSYVRHVAERIAEIRGMTLEEVAEATFKNTCELFRINV